MKSRFFIATVVWATIAMPAVAYAVYGAIGEKYKELGAEQGILGAPKSDELPAAGGGRFNQFEWGYIFWRADLGAHYVLYPLDRKWIGMGREGGFGYPVTDTFNSAQGGKCNDFEHGGTICWNPKTGQAQAVYGLIRERWVQLGREGGVCGYPTSDEFAWLGQRRSSFDRGYITWSAHAGVTVHGC